MKLLPNEDLLIQVTSLEKSIAFYKKLGLKEISPAEPQRFSLGHTKISFEKKSEYYIPKAGYARIGSFNLCLFMDKPLEEVQKDLERNQISPVTPILKTRGARGKISSLYLQDPDGYLVQLAYVPPKKAISFFPTDSELHYDE